MCFYKKFIRLPSFQITTDNWTEGNCQLSAHPKPELNLDVQIEPFRGIMPEIKCRYFKFILFIYLNNKLLLIVSTHNVSYICRQTNYWVEFYLASLPVTQSLLLTSCKWSQDCEKYASAGQTTGSGHRVNLISNKLRF